MVQPSTAQQNKTETEVAVLQVQYLNLNEKVEDIKSGLKDLRQHIDSQTESTQDLIKGFQDDNVKSHKEMSNKISSLEKWRWMIMGAGIVLGSLGFEAVSKLFGM